MTNSRLAAAVPYVLYAAVAVWFCGPLFASPNGLGVQDWDQHLFYYGSVFKSVVEYGQLPFWNPWYCGGNVLWQNPQVPLLSPAFPLALVMSLPLAMKINIALHYWVGLAGMHLLLTSSLGVRSRPVAVALSIIAACSGGTAMHLAVGHSVFLPVLYLPLQVHLLVRSVRSALVRDAALAALPLSLMVYNGALHAVPMTVVGVGVFCVTAAVALRRARPVIVGLLIGVFLIGYTAPRLIPIALFTTGSQFRDARPQTEHPDAMSVEMLVRTYIDRYQYRNLQLDGQRSGWFEYGNYIGGVGAAALAAGIVLALFVPGTRERWLGVSLAAAALMCLALSAGEFATLAPANLIRSLPFFSSYRIPSRYTLAFVLFGFATAGWAWAAVADASEDGAASRAVRAMSVAVGLLAVLDVTTANRQQFEGVFSVPPLDAGFRLMRGSTTEPRLEVAGDPYGRDSPMLHGLVHDTDFQNCYEPLQVTRNMALDQPLVFTDGKAQLYGPAHFTPNRVDVSVVNGRDTSELRLNQNPSNGWSSTAGPVTVDAKAGMRVALAPGTAGTVTFRYRPPGLIVGVLVAMASLAFTIAARRWVLPAV